MIDWKTSFKALPIGKGRIIKEGFGIALISIGHIGNNVVEATKILEKENINVAHYDVRFLKPIDEELLHQIFRKFNTIVTVEDGTIQGGLGSAVLEFMADNNYTAKNNTTLAFQTDL